MLTAGLGSGDHQPCRVLLLSLSRQHLAKLKDSRALKSASCGLHQVCCQGHSLPAHI